MIDTIYIEGVKEKLYKQLEKEKGLLLKIDSDKNLNLYVKKEESERMVRYGNIRYIEGQINILNSLLSLYL